MPELLFLIVVAIGIVAITVGRRRARRARRERLRAAPFPDAWRAILERSVELYRHLPPALRQELEGHTQVFLAEKHFEGCGGLNLTDEIRVTIAAQACLLLLNRRTDYYPRLASILVYPGVYRPRRFTGRGLHHEPADVALAGESWRTGAVVLAWDAARRGALDGRDADNVVLHEFAHQLDQEDGAANGAPVLERPSSYAAWARILSREYAALQEHANRGQRTLLDEYGATNPGEFFAVATETFFEKPQEMRQEHPELYGQLAAYYKLDPAAWIEEKPEQGSASGPPGRS